MAAPWPFQSVTAPNFLSGIFAWTTAFALPPNLAALSTPVRVKSCWVVNTTSAMQIVDIEDGSGAAIVSALPIAGHAVIRIEEVELESFVGLQVKSSIASGVQGQIEGWV